MAVIARTPREAFRRWKDHTNQALNKVLTHYHLQVPVRHTKQERAVLSFLDGERKYIAIPLESSPWYLFVSQRLQAIAQGKDYVLQVLAYEYRIQRTPSRDDEAEVRFEYVSPAIDPAFPYSRHHVQFHRGFQDVRDGFSPNTLHIPTGGVTIAHVIRFLIADLGVPPLVSNWDETLNESEARSWEWMSAAQ